jgi:hypothetical protein
MRMHRDGFKMKGRRIALHIIGGVVMAVVFAILFGYFVMLLWNNLLPDIFNLKVITYWQAIGLVVLARFIFGSHGFHKHGNRSGRCSHHQDGHSHFGNDDSDEPTREWWDSEGKVAFQQYLGNKKQQ